MLSHKWDTPRLKEDGGKEDTQRMQESGEGVELWEHYPLHVKCPWHFELPSAMTFCQESATEDL